MPHTLRGNSGTQPKLLLPQLALPQELLQARVDGPSIGEVHSVPQFRNRRQTGSVKNLSHI